jgi:hypothetical protein
LTEKPYHEIEIDQLLKILSIKNQVTLCKKLETMKKSFLCNPLNWDLYFEDIKINNNVVSYSYPHHLKLLLSHKFVYEITKKLNAINFKSKYALFLYELCLYRSILKYKNVFILPALKSYFGITQAKYINNSKYLISSIFIKALHELHEKTDLSIKISAFKDGKSVIMYVFNVEKNPELTTSAHESYDFALRNLAYAKAFFYHEELSTEKKIIEQYVSQSERDFLSKFYSTSPEKLQAFKRGNEWRGESYEVLAQ